MFEIRKYNDADKEVWNAYVEHARNATFLLNRSYMDYHSDRFHDHSLMIFHNNKLYALLPANEDGDVFYSHQGLTYAGLLTTGHASAENICQVFVAINTYLKQAGFRKCIYKLYPGFTSNCQLKKTSMPSSRNAGRKSAPETLRLSST